MQLWIQCKFKIKFNLLKSDPPKSHFFGYLKLEDTFILRIYDFFKAIVIYGLLVIYFKMLKLFNVKLKGLLMRHEIFGRIGVVAVKLSYGVAVDLLCFYFKDEQARLWSWPLTEVESLSLHSFVDHCYRIRNTGDNIWVSWCYFLIFKFLMYTLYVERSNMI